MRFDSIQTRLILVAFVFITGTAAIIGFAGIKYSSAFLAERYHAGFRVLADYMARNAELGVLLGDRKMLERQSGNMLTQKDVVKVTILSEEGVILASASNPTLGQRDFMRVEAEIRSSEAGDDSMLLYARGRTTNLGRVIIEYSSENIDMLKEKLIYRFLILSMVLSIISVIWYSFFARSISAPLRDLVTISRAVSRGEMDKRAMLTNLHETRVLARTFNEMMDAIQGQRRELEDAHAKMLRQNALAEVGKFSMLVAHEIKNPLAIIKGSFDILKKENISSEIRKQMMDYQEDELVRINRLVEDFLLFSKPKEPDLVPVDMNAFVRNLTEKTGFISAGSIRIKTVVDSRETVVLCDRNLMERALMNVIKNGLEACGKEGLLTITTGQKEGLWFFRTEDTGKGILEQDLDKLFNPFFTTKAKGTGLGLAMVKEIVELHNGKVFAGNNKDCGAWFEISTGVYDG